jgi:hypothetical protein
MFVKLVDTHLVVTQVGVVDGSMERCRVDTG